MYDKSEIIWKIIAVVAGAAALAICGTLEEKSQEEVLRLCNFKDSNE